MVPGMDQKIADLERALCAQDRHSLPDMAVRDRHLRRARHLPQGGHGVNAPVARKQDYPTVTLGLLCARQAKDVVSGYRQVRAYKLVEEFEKTKDGARRKELSFEPGESLESVLLKCFHQCAIDPQFRLVELQVDHSPVEPRATLSVGHYKGGITPEHRTETYILTFAGSPAPAANPPKPPDVVEHIMRLREDGLMTLVNLYALSVQLPPANEFGPSVRADEPVSMSPETLKDRHRAPTRKRQKRA
jgi:hypothetical protein